MFLDLKDYWKYLEDSRLVYFICDGLCLFLYGVVVIRSFLILYFFYKINVLLEILDFLVFDLVLK